MDGAAAGRLVIISGPSGVGKTTILKELFRACALPLTASVSATTRPPRPGEASGRDYHFLTAEEFARRRERGEFLECFEVFGRGHWYGTLRDEVEQGLAHGRWVVLDIDVQGAMEVVRQFPTAVTIFVRPRDPQELERRLRERGTEREEDVQRRLATARRELSFAERYQHQVVNDQVEHAVREICRILQSESGSAHD